MTQKTITIVLILIVIGGLAWYINKTYLKPTSEPSGAANSGQEAQAADTLVYVVSGPTKAIWTRDQNGNLRKIFTDADEREKLVKISNVAAKAGEVLAITNRDTGASNGKLISIELATGSKTALQDNFASPRSWSLSGDGGKLAYVLFSNVEENYGYTLYSESVTGQERTKLFNSASEIKSPAWSPDQTKIAIAATEGTTGQLKLVDLATKSASDLKSFPNQIIDGVTWLSREKIAFSLRDIGADKGKIKVVDVTEKNLIQITDYTGGQISFIAASADENFLSFLVAQYGENFNDKTSGQILIENLTDQSEKAVGKGNQILGWLP